MRTVTVEVNKKRHELVIVKWHEYNMLCYLIYSGKQMLGSLMVTKKRITVVQGKHSESRAFFPLGEEREAFAHFCNKL